MKRLLVVLFVIMVLPRSYCQLVPSSCTAPQGTVDMYSDDADRMTVLNTLRNNTIWKDSVDINPVINDTLLKAMIAVYNAVALPARDTVVVIANIHTKPIFTLNELVLAADSNLTWVKELKKGHLLTGNNEVDSLIRLGNITNIKMGFYSTSSQAQYITLSSTNNQNLIPVVDGFSSLPGVVYAYRNSFYGADGNDIQDSIHDEFIELIYSYGWCDCITSCKYRRYWKFRVHPGCSVEYVGSYGDVVPADLSIEDEQEERFTVSPNPFTSHINVTGVAKKGSYVLYNSLGQKMQSGDMSEGLIEMDSGLPPGSYFLSIRSGTGEWSNFHLIKN